MIEKSIESKLRHARKRLSEFKDRYGHTDKELQDRLSFHGARDLGYFEGRLSVLEDLQDELEDDIKIDTTPMNLSSIKTTKVKDGDCIKDVYCGINYDLPQELFKKESK